MFQLCASLACVLSLPHADRPASSELTRCAEYLASELVEREGVSALSLCIRVDGKQWLAISRGWIDEGRAQPVTSETRFPVGSLSRVFNAAAVLEQVERGALALDDEIAGRLPGKTVLAQPVRLRHVLAGTSGIAPWARVFTAGGKTPEAGLRTEALLALFGTAPFDFAPGVEYAPNSAAWALLPFVLERAWELPYEAGLREHLLAPAGLTHTTVCTSDVPALGAARDCEAVAAAHDLELDLARSSPAALPTLCSSAVDLAAWMEALGAGRVLGAEALATLTTAAERTAGQSTGHGYALDLDELAQHPRWWHSGGIGNFRARMSWYPDDQLAIAAISNCTSADVDELETELARFVLALPATRRLDLPLTTEESARFAGNYQIATTRVRISARAGHLVWQDLETERECAWQGRTKFVDLADPQFVLRFELEGERATKFELQRGSSTVSGLRVD
jgi:CubicO group peptidase (beta-lactamase class C family)